MEFLRLLQSNLDVIIPMVSGIGGFFGGVFKEKRGRKQKKNDALIQFKKELSYHLVKNRENYLAVEFFSTYDKSINSGYRAARNIELEQAYINMDSYLRKAGSTLIDFQDIIDKSEYYELQQRFTLTFVKCREGDTKYYFDLDNWCHGHTMKSLNKIDKYGESEE